MPCQSPRIRLRASKFVLFPSISNVQELTVVSREVARYNFGRQHCNWLHCYNKSKSHVLFYLQCAREVGSRACLPASPPEQHQSRKRPGEVHVALNPDSGAIHLSRSAHRSCRRARCTWAAGAAVESALPGAVELPGQRLATGRQQPPDQPSDSILIYPVSASRSSHSGGGCAVRNSLLIDAPR